MMSTGQRRQDCEVHWVGLDVSKRTFDRPFLSAAPYHARYFGSAFCNRSPANVRPPFRL